MTLKFYKQILPWPQTKLVMAHKHFLGEKMRIWLYYYPIDPNNLYINEIWLITFFREMRNWGLRTRDLRELTTVI